MSKGVWPAVSGSIAQSQRLDVVANNLANANTAGFKRDAAVFKHILSDAEKAAAKEDVPRQPLTDKDFYRLDGRDTAYVVLDGVYTDHSQGMAKTTNAPLDVAIEGKGFFEVLTPSGVRYTRQGNFQINGEGALVTIEGFPVLAAGGGGEGPGATREQLAARAITLDSNKAGSITINRDGTLYSGKDLVNQISVVEFVDNKLLEKEGSSTYRNETAANLIREITGSQVRQGMLETSNVNPVRELTDMLSATRAFEANQKVVKTYGELESKAVNDIGKL